MALYNRRKRNYAAMAGRAVQAYQLYKKARSYTKTYQKKRQAPSAGITQQHDSRMVYRRKKMPYRKKRQWVKFSRKVNAVITKNIGANVNIFNSSISSISGTTAFPQGYQFHVLYGKRGSVGSSITDSGVDDIFQTARRGLVVNDAAKYQFTSAVLDYTGTNISTVTMEVDIYHVVFWKEAGYLSPEAALIAAQNATPTNSATPAPMTLQQRGVTPFDIPVFIRSIGLKILKKIKYFVAPGNAITYQIRDSRNRMIAGTEISDNNPDFVQPGWTQGILIIHRPIPGYPVIADPGYVLSSGVTRKYSMKILQDNANVDGYTAGTS